MNTIQNIYDYILLENKYDDALKNFLKQDDTKEKLKRIGLDGFEWGDGKTVNVEDTETVKPFLRHTIGIISDKNYRTYQKAIARLWIDMMLEKNPEKETSFEQDMKGILKAISETPDDNLDLSGKPMNQLQSEYNQKIASANDEVLNRIKGKTYDSKTDYKIVEIHNFEEAKAYYKYTSDLHTPWCVTHMENMFDNYSSGGVNKIYFALKNGFEKLRKPKEETIDTPYDEYGMSMMFIAISPSGMINNITSRWNHDASVPEKESKWYGYGNSDTHYFEKDREYDTDLLSKMFGGNFYDILKPKSFDEIISDFKEVINTPNDYSFYIKSSKKKSYILIDKKTDKPLSKKMYDYTGDFDNEFVPVGLNGKYGFINTEGNEIIPCKYDDDRNFHEGLAAVKLNKKWGYINREGKEIVPCKYDFAYDFNEGFAIVKLNGECGYINTEGKEIVPCKYDFAGDFHEGLAKVELNRKLGFINTEGKEIVPYKYDDADNFEEGFAAVILNGKYGFVNAEGKEVISCKYDGARNFHEGLAAVELNGKWGYINTEGNEIIPCKYDDAYDFKEGLAVIGGLNGYYGYINREGEETIPCKYDDAYDFKDGVAFVKLNRYSGYINKNGEFFNTKRKARQSISESYNILNIKHLDFVPLFEEFLNKQELLKAESNYSDYKKTSY